MPTPVIIDGFEHQIISLNSFGGTTEGVWNTAVDGTPTFPAGRNGVCMQIAATAAQVRAIKRVADPTILVMSLYIKTTSAPGANADIFQTQTGGFSTAGRLVLLSTGRLRMMCSGGTQDTAGTYNDGTWHRIDVRINVSANPWTVDWQVDGSAQTQVTAVVAANSIRYIIFGTSSAETITCQYDDFVASSTSGDYPLGAHDVLYGVPTGDGTHAAGTNVIEDNAGTDITSPNAFPLMDEWAPNTADFVRQFATGAGNYAEVTFDDQPANKTIWGVEGVAAMLSSSTTANNGTTRIVDSAGTTLTDIYASDMSETSLHYRRAIITAPGGGWDGAGYAGVKARVGFSTNVASLPEWSALMLQYACVDAGGAAAAVDPMGMSGFFGG